MKFKTKQEAIRHASLPYLKDDCMTMMDTNSYINDLINKRFKAEDKNKDMKISLISVEEKDNGKFEFYYIDYSNGLKLFPTEKDKVYITEEEFKKGWHEQYLNWQIKEAEKDSANYVFKEHLTKEQVGGRHEMFQLFAEAFHQIFY